MRLQPGRLKTRGQIVQMNGANIDALLADLNAALARFLVPFERDVALWSRRPPGKWSAGQQADHIAKGLEVTAAALEENERHMKDGTLKRRPWRDPLQALFVSIAVGAGKFPRGGRAPQVIVPAAEPQREDVFERIARAADRHRALASRLGVDQRDRLWISNPFLPRWHYTFPEVMRVQAVHARHHAQQVEAIAVHRAAGPERD